MKCYRELNWGENWKPFEFFAIFNQILKRILDFRFNKPVLAGYDPKIRCNIDSKGFWILLGIKIICQSIITNGAKDSCAKERKIWGYYVRSEMVLWHLEFRPQVRLTIYGGQFVPLEMVLWHSKDISAAVELALKPVLLDKLKVLYILVFNTFFDDWWQMGNLRAFIRPGSL